MKPFVTLHESHRSGGHPRIEIKMTYMRRLVLTQVLVSCLFSPMSFAHNDEQKSSRKKPNVIQRDRAYVLALGGGVIPPQSPPRVQISNEEVNATRPPRGTECFLVGDNKVECFVPHNSPICGIAKATELALEVARQVCNKRFSTNCSEYPYTYMPEGTVNNSRDACLTYGAYYVDSSPTRHGSKTELYLPSAEIPIQLSPAFQFLSVYNGTILAGTMGPNSIITLGRLQRPANTQALRFAVPNIRPENFCVVKFGTPSNILQILEAQQLVVMRPPEYGQERYGPLNVYEFNTVEFAVHPNAADVASIKCEMMGHSQPPEINYGDFNDRFDSSDPQGISRYLQLHPVAQIGARP